MYRQVLDSCKNTTKLVHSFLAIASCSLLLVGVAQASDLPSLDVEESAPIDQDLDGAAAAAKVAKVKPLFSTVVMPRPQRSRTILPASTEIRSFTANLGTLLLPAPTNTPAVPLKAAPTSPQLPATSDPRYLVAPEVLEAQTVDPFATQFVLNGNRLSHLSTTQVTSGYESGNFRTSDLNFDIYQPSKATNIQSVTADRVLHVQTNMEVSAARSVIQNQDITVAVSRPQTLVGVRQQISLTADCLDNSGRVCTYLPGLKIDESMINQRTLQPVDVKVTSQFGDVVPASAVAQMRQSGFQGGANGNNSASYGLDLYFPAVGVVSPVGSPPPVLTGSRREDLNTGLAVSHSWLNQDFATNGESASLGRTIRSVNYINGDRNQLVNLAVQALGQVLPAWQPQIAPGQPGAQIVVNPNLFRAANALRLPEQGLTVYQGGLGMAASRGDDLRTPPAASHQALWLGLSPVIDRQLERDYYYQTLRAPVVVSRGGGEGGNVPVNVNLNGTNFNTGALQNPYAQAYVTVYNRDVDRYDVETIRQRTDYYPHLSLTGTNLTENTLWRYFAGTILNMGVPSSATSNLKAYIGTDYSIVNPRGLSFTVGGVGYLNPDPEHYTQLFVKVSQSIALGDHRQLVLGANANYVADGTVTVQSLPVRSAQSAVNVGATFNLGDISVGATQFVGNLLPEAIDSKTLLNFGWKINDRFNFGAFYTPFDQSISTAPFGANVGWAVDPTTNSKLYLSWNAAAIDFRRSLGAASNVFRDNTFSLSFRRQF